MKIPTMKGTCDICGGELSIPETMSHYGWDNEYIVVHKYPQVCTDNLKRKEQKEKEKNEVKP